MPHPIVSKRQSEDTEDRCPDPGELKGGFFVHPVANNQGQLDDPNMKNVQRKGHLRGSEKRPQPSGRAGLICQFYTRQDNQKGRSAGRKYRQN